MAKKVKVFDQQPVNKGFVLWQLSNQWQRGINSVLKEYDLTHVQYILLEAIIQLGDFYEHVSQKSLADHANANTMMTSKVLRSLEKKGFIIRAGQDYDTRAKDVSITREGKALYKKVSRRVDQFDNQFFGQLGTRLSSFINALQSLTLQ
ncbi:MAG: MarR family transcriptional regulator [Saprospiraceae bacterium]|nr:MarR family transcriptional regulator [Saprospiraceae bacterium]